jgi:hypothetical protein
VNNAAALMKQFLVDRPGQFFCNRCLNGEAGTTTAAQVTNLTRPLRGVKPFRSGTISCSRCNDYRECIAYQN